jgi:hypothetical protein
MKSGFFYRLARIIRDFEVLLSGNPNKIARRYANKVIAKNIARRMFLNPPKGGG